MIGPRSFRCTSSTRTATRMRGPTHESRPIALEQVRPGGCRGALPPSDRRGADRSRGFPAREIAEVHESRGDLLDRLGAYEQAAASYRAARRLVCGDPLAQSKLYLKEAWISDRVGRYRQGLRWVTRARQALEGLEGEEAGRQRARLSAWYAALRQGQGRYREVWPGASWRSRRPRCRGSARRSPRRTSSWTGRSVDLGELEKATYSPRALEIYLELGNLARLPPCSTTWACSRTSEGGGTRPSTSTSRGTTCGSRSATPSMRPWGR